MTEAHSEHALSRSRTPLSNLLSRSNSASSSELSAVSPVFMQAATLQRWHYEQLQLDEAVKVLSGFRWDVERLQMWKRWLEEGDGGILGLRSLVEHHARPLHDLQTPLQSAEGLTYIFFSASSVRPARGHLQQPFLSSQAAGAHQEHPPRLDLRSSSLELGASTPFPSSLPPSNLYFAPLPAFELVILLSLCFLPLSPCSTTSNPDLDSHLAAF